jgi:hypothetical protein
MRSPALSIFGCVCSRPLIIVTAERCRIVAAERCRRRFVFQGRRAGNPLSSWAGRAKWAPDPLSFPSPVVRRHTPCLWVVNRMAVDARYRDKDGVISRKHGNTLIGRLRVSYGCSKFGLMITMSAMDSVHSGRRVSPTRIFNHGLRFWMWVAVI